MHVLGMPPAFVLSQDQTLRLTLDLPTNRQNRPARTSKIRIPSLKTRSSRRHPEMQNLQITPEIRKTKHPRSRNTQSNRSISQQPPAQDRRPRIPSQIPQCQTTTPVRPKTREPPSPFTGLGDPLRPVGACRQSKERCRNLHGPAFAGGCRLATAEGPI